MTDYISRADAIDALYRSSVYSWSVEQDQSAHTWALNIIAELPSAKYITEKPNDAVKASNDVINRADAIDAVMKHKMPFSIQQEMAREIDALPSADAVSREQYDHVCEEYNRLVHKAVCVKLCDENCEYEKGKTCYHAREHYAVDSVLSADAEPKWSCTANFVAEQLDRLRNMTDEEKWNFFRKFFGMGDAVDENEDYVAVVRCKDCRHGWYDDDIEYYTCRHPKGLNEELYGVDFCSYGERKE